MHRHPFDTDTAVEPAGDSLARATVTNRWDRLLGGPLGGYLVAICLRALRERLTFSDPLVLSAFFLRPAAPGPAKVETEVVRQGRRVATAEARLIQGEKERLRVVATFTDLRRTFGRSVMLNQPPKLPPPDDAIDPLAGLPIERATIADQVELRTPAPPGWRQGEPSGDAAGAMWVRLKGGREPDLLTLAVMVDALPLAVLELGEAGSTTLELTVHMRDHPAPGWLACRNRTRHVIAGLHEEDAEIWDARGKLVAQSRQLAILGR